MTLPDDAGTMYPRIPAELVGKQIPGFVAEWIIESDEMGVIIQELLNAPTRSLCRCMALPTSAVGLDRVKVQVSGILGTSLINNLSPMPLGDVRGFEAAPQAIVGLPEGIELPARLVEIVEMSKRLDGWIQKGRRVREWAEDSGYADLSWLPPAS